MGQTSSALDSNAPPIKTKRLTRGAARAGPSHRIPQRKSSVRVSNPTARNTAPSRGNAELAAAARERDRLSTRAIVRGERASEGGGELEGLCIRGGNQSNRLGRQASQYDDGSSEWRNSAVPSHERHSMAKAGTYFREEQSVARDDISSYYGTSDAPSNPDLHSDPHTRHGSLPGPPARLMPTTASQLARNSIFQPDHSSPSSPLRHPFAVSLDEAPAPSPASVYPDSAASPVNSRWSRSSHGETSPPIQMLNYRDSFGQTFQAGRHTFCSDPDAVVTPLIESPSVAMQSFNLAGVGTAHQKPVRKISIRKRGSGGARAGLSPGLYSTRAGCDADERESAIEEPTMGWKRNTYVIRGSKGSHRSSVQSERRLGERRRSSALAAEAPREGSVPEWALQLAVDESSWIDMDSALPSPRLQDRPLPPPPPPRTSRQSGPPEPNRQSPTLLTTRNSFATSPRLASSDCFAASRQKEGRTTSFAPFSSYGGLANHHARFQDTSAQPSVDKPLPSPSSTSRSVLRARQESGQRPTDDDPRATREPQRHQPNVLRKASANRPPVAPAWPADDASLRRNSFAGSGPPTIAPAAPRTVRISLNSSRTSSIQADDTPLSPQTRRSSFPRAFSTVGSGGPASRHKRSVSMVSAQPLVSNSAPEVTPRMRLPVESACEWGTYSVSAHNTPMNRPLSVVEVPPDTWELQAPALPSTRHPLAGPRFDVRDQSTNPPAFGSTAATPRSLRGNLRQSIASFMSTATDDTAFHATIGRADRLSSTSGKIEPVHAIFNVVQLDAAAKRSTFAPLGRPGDSRPVPSSSSGGSRSPDEHLTPPSGAGRRWDASVASAASSSPPPYSGGTPSISTSVVGSPGKYVPEKISSATDSLNPSPMSPAVVSLSPQFDFGGFGSHAPPTQTPKRRLSDGGYSSPMSRLDRQMEAFHYAGADSPGSDYGEFRAVLHETPEVEDSLRMFHSDVLDSPVAFNFIPESPATAMGSPFVSLASPRAGHSAPRRVYSTKSRSGPARIAVQSSPWKRPRPTTNASMPPDAASPLRGTLPSSAPILRSRTKSIALPTNSSGSSGNYGVQREFKRRGSAVGPDVSRLGEAGKRGFDKVEIRGWMMAARRESCASDMATTDRAGLL